MTYHAHVSDDGMFVVPAELTRAIGLAPGDRLTLDANGSSIIVKTYADIVREGQDAYRATIKRPFTVDDFLAERHAEATRD